MAETLSISGEPVLTGAVGAPYDGFTVSAGGGQGGDYQYAIYSGELPSGVTVDRWSGTVSGTPDADGTFTAVISATDAAGNVALLPAFMITVTP